MSTLPTIDSGTLGWVKSEIEDTALQSRELLTKYEDDSSDSSTIRLCATYLHQIYGTLTMVELDGAARLVHESEGLAQKLADREVEWSAESGAALRHALDDLSNYLEGLQSSPVPSPLQLVESINRVLAARGDEPISELELFAPDLSARPPEARMQNKVDAALFVKLADNLRMRFERALLNVLRNPEDRDALGEIHKVFSNLASVDRRGSLRQLWWVVAGIGEALLDGSLEFNDETRLILARVNEQLKRLQDKTQAVKRRAPPDDLIKRGLLLLARSGGEGPTVNGIRKSFGLDDWVRHSALEGLPDAESLAASLVQFLSEADTDLTQAQNLLARYFSPQGGGPDVLDRLAARLESLQVAARRNELALVERLIAALGDVVAAIRNDTLPDMENASLQMAGALLFVQDSGSGIRPGFEWKGQAEATIGALQALVVNTGEMEPDGAMDSESRSATVATGVVDDVARVAATEVRSELQYVEHALEQVANKESSSGSLKSVEAHLKRVEGTLEILEQTHAAGLAEQLRLAVRGVVDTDSLDSRKLDALAMAVGTLGVCADELRAGGSLERLDPTINRAREELSSLAGLDAGSEDLLSLESVSLSNGGHVSERNSGGSAQGWSQDIDYLPLEFEDEALGTDDDSAPPVASVEGMDDELVGIFLEEAAEIEPQITDSKSRWRENAEDTSALKDLRRCFHTLKGSGRFARATAIAELSWIVEDLLNGIIENQLNPTPEIHAFVDRAHTTLADLIRRGDVDAVLDLTPWRRDADALKTPDSPELEDLARDLGAELLSFDSPDAPSAASSNSEIGVLELDGADDAEQVYKVFRAELEGHIETIADCVAQARRQFPAWEIPDTLLRTSHTLRGVLRSVGFESPAHVADGLDDLLGFLSRRSENLEEVDLVLIDQAGRLLKLAAGKMDASLQLTPGHARQFDELAAALVQRLRYLGTGPLEVLDSQAEAHIPYTSAVVESSVAEPPVAEVQVTEAQVTEPLSDEDDELLQAFREEAQEILARFDHQIELWRDGAPAGDVLSAMRRELHTFKGGARAIGWRSLGELAHEAETLLENERVALTPRKQVSDLLQEVHDVAAVAATSPIGHMTDEIERLGHRIIDFEPEAETGLGVTEGEAGPRIEAEVKAEVADEVDPGTLPGRIERLPDVPMPFPAGSEGRAVRVRTEVLDELVSYAGEVSILRSRLQQQIQMVKSNLNELGDTVRSFRDQLRDLEIESEAQMLATNERIREEGGVSEFDPLELDRFSRLQTLSRNLSESLGGLVSIQAGISEFAGDAENTLQQQRHLSESLQEGLLKTRMISFVSLVPRLRHLTRQTSNELGRSVNLEVSGEQVEVDRKILDQMLPSFEHMIRNAVSHGVEESGERVAAGKPSAGTIRIALEQDGNDIVIRIADDGRGIDVPSIEARARKLGLLASGEQLGDEELMRALAASGLSTAAQVTQVSGRGVGMDVVSEMVRQLGGSIAVETSRGEGTTFILRVPVTLAVGHALLVYAGEQMFAVPARLIVNVLRVRKSDVEDGDQDADAYTYYNDRRTPVLNLANRLGLPFRASARDVVNIIMVRAGLREIGLWVESISDTREVVVKPVGPLLRSIPGIGAVTLLGDGSIVLILDIPELWRMRQINVVSDTYAIAPTRGDNVTVMVVDDSMTVRNVMGRDLQNNGFEVILAKDGVDAIEQLRHAVPDILLVDLEMPRMDGFELTRRVRDDQNLKDLPILIITSRAGSRHRDQAIRLGADGYMSKPYRLDELVKSISSLTAASSPETEATLETSH